MACNSFTLSIADLVYLLLLVNDVPVQTLEEVIRQLQEDNMQMRARSEVEMQVEVQRQVESQLQEHMRQRELEANAREEAREREAKIRDWKEIPEAFSVTDPSKTTNTDGFPTELTVAKAL
ncbi:hypothetical protein Tco_0233686 [Tanacetum coccineum]